MIDQDFTMVQGDTEVLSVAIVDDVGAILNLAGFTLRWAVRSGIGRTVVLAKATGGGITVATPATGVCVIALAPADTLTLTPGTYVHELEGTDSGGGVSTLLRGYLTLLGSIAP